MLKWGIGAAKVSDSFIELFRKSFVSTSLVAKFETK